MCSCLCVLVGVFVCAVFWCVLCVCRCFDVAVFIHVVARRCFLLCHLHKTVVVCDVFSKWLNIWTSVWCVRVCVGVVGRLGSCSDVCGCLCALCFGVSICVSHYCPLILCFPFYFVVLFFVFFFFAVFVFDDFLFMIFVSCSRFS